MESRLKVDLAASAHSVQITAPLIELEVSCVRASALGSLIQNRAMPINLTHQSPTARKPEVSTKRTSE
jgi:hypothetical protein